jgi:ABC-2 type transport system permease protein
MNAGLSPGEFTADAAPAAAARRVVAQARFDAAAMLRNGEQVLLTIALPVIVLVVLGRVSATPALGAGRRIDVVTAGVIALAVMSTAFTGQAIATAFDRRYGVLRLLGTTPLGRRGLVAGRALALLVVEAVQVVVIGLAALVLGWHPDVSGLAPALAAALLGTLTFASLGLLLAGTLRPEAVLAGANLAWVLLMVGGGIVVPAARLGALEPLARTLPSGALGDAMRTALVDGRADAAALAVLAGWALVAGAAAARWFRWD